MASVAPVPPVEAVARTIYASWWHEPGEDDAEPGEPHPPWEDLPLDDPDRQAAMQEASDVLADLAASRGSARSHLNDISPPRTRPRG